jgi:hypothetical protein
MALTPTLRPQHNRKVERERRLALLALAILVIAWIGGSLRATSSVVPYLTAALPGAQRFEPLAGGIYAGWAGEATTGQPLGYVAAGEATGYGGPMKVAVGVDAQGKIVGVAVVEQRESRAWLDMVIGRRFLELLVGKSSADRLMLGDDVDAVSGATYTARAITEATRQAAQRVAVQKLGLPVPVEPAKAIRIGGPEIALILLYTLGFIGHQRTFRFKKQVRWLALIGGLLTIGLLYNSPLTLANISALLLGYWPDWHSNLYWYLLIGGIVFVYTVDNKNPYCDWFCPFGAAQECLGALGGAEPLSRSRYRNLLAWLQRGLALAAVALALFFRNPGLTSFEVFGTLFRLKGSPMQFALLFIVLAMALVFKRPWCAWLCPLHPVTDFIRLLRTWILETWANIRYKAIR